jgi:hypothetical protein
VSISIFVFAHPPATLDRQPADPVESELVEWMNSHISKDGGPLISNTHSDLKDGVALIRLLVRPSPSSLPPSFYTSFSFFPIFMILVIINDLIFNNQFNKIYIG